MNFNWVGLITVDLYLVALNKMRVSYPVLILPVSDSKSMTFVVQTLEYILYVAVQRRHTLKYTCFEMFRNL